MTNRAPIQLRQLLFGAVVTAAIISLSPGLSAAPDTMASKPANSKTEVITANPGRREPNSPDDDSATDNVVGVKSFRGQAVQGSDVELYADDVLLMARIVDASGKYEFTNIPVHFGTNVFRTSVYGPNGGHDDHVEVVTVPLPPDAGKPVKAESPLPATKTANAGPAIQEKPKSLPVMTPLPSLTKPVPPQAATERPVANDMVFLNVVRNKLTLGAVESHFEKQNTWLNLKNLLALLGISYSRNPTNDSADITLKDGSVVSLDFQKGEFVETNTHRSFYSYDIYKKGEEIYANVELLNRMLPHVGFVVDLASQKVEVENTDTGLLSLLSGNVTPTKAELAPPPLPAVVQPVIIDDLSGHLRISGSPVAEPLTEAGDVLHINENDKSSKLVPVQPSVPPKPQETTAHEEKEALPEQSDKPENLILQPRIKNLAPSDQFMEALEIKGKVYLPLRDVIQLFEFPIIFDKENKFVSGFFFTPDNTFLLDRDKREVHIGSRHVDFTEQEVLQHEGQLYINSDNFADWFGIKSDIDRSKATIHFIVDKLLPEEEKEERQKRWRALMGAVDKSDKTYPVLQNPYQALGYPTLDANLGSAYSKTSTTATSSANGQKPVISNYNLQGSDDIGFLTGKFYAQGSTDAGALNILRLQAGRVDPGGALLGSMQATEFELGDVTSPSLSLVTSSTLGRGATVTNREVNASENFDFRNFTGDSVPGYEVELYRNDVLVAFQTVDATGRYNFVNIPILYGENIFRIVFYGQQGQREERVEMVSAASSLLKQNQFVYTFGLEQAGQSLIPIGSSNQTSFGNPPGVQALGDFHYGVTRDVTIGAALAETNLADGEHRYLETSTGANIFGILTEGDFAQDLTNNGWAASAAALGGFDGISLRARYRKFDNFFSGAVNTFSSIPLSSDENFDANTQLYLPLLGSYSVGLSALHENFVDPLQVPRDTYSWRSSKSIGGISFTDSIEYVIDAAKRFQDTFGVQTRLFNTDFRAVGITDVKPDQRLREASLMADYKLSDKLSAQTQFDKNLLDNQTSYGQNFNWDFDKFRLSFTGQVTNGGTYSAGLNLIFSINHDNATDTWHMQPRQTADSGAVSGRVYIDENNNGRKDDGDKVYTEAKVKVNKVLVVPNEDDYFVAPVAPYQVNHVELDTSSIADPLLTAETTGYDVITRPGDNVVADFPLARTTLIDGSVSFIDRNGKKRDLSDIVVELEDGAGKPLRRVISAIDGYFSFDKIQVGDYWLSVPDEALRAFDAVMENRLPIKIEKIDEFMTGNEIILHEKEPLDIDSLMLPPLPILFTPVVSDKAVLPLCRPDKHNDEFPFTAIVSSPLDLPVTANGLDLTTQHDEIK